MDLSEDNTCLWFILGNEPKGISIDMRRIYELFEIMLFIVV